MNPFNAMTIEQIHEQNQLIIKQNEMILKLLSKREPKTPKKIESLKESLLKKHSKK